MNKSEVLKLRVTRLNTSQNKVTNDQMVINFSKKLGL